MDAGVGRILDELDRRGLTESTLVCFLSDNGFSAGHHGVWGKGNGTSPQNMYDESVKVPMIFSQPGRVPGGRVSDVLASGYDIRPTLLSYLDIADPDSHLLPGRSLAPLLRGEATASGHERVVVYGEYGPVRMIRTPDAKYVHRYPHGPNELYVLSDDPHERVNLVADPSRARLRHELRFELRAWFIEHSDPRVDGVYEANTGRGQVGPAGSLRTAFRPEPTQER